MLSKDLASQSIYDKKNMFKSNLGNIFIFLLFLDYLLDFTSYSQFILINLFSYYINSWCLIFKNNWIIFRI